jgi:hypothetical protein
MRKIRSIYDFYQSFAFTSILITSICAYFLFKYGIGAFAVLSWFKIFTFGLIYYIVNTYKKNELYYYKNIGLGKSVLWWGAVSIDLILYMLLLIISLKLRCYIPLK